MGCSRLIYERETFSLVLDGFSLSSFWDDVPVALVSGSIFLSSLLKALLVGGTLFSLRGLWFHISFLLSKVWAAAKQAQQDQATQEDQAGYEREKQDIGAPSGQVEIEGNGQKPELDTHQEDTDREASKYDGYPARWGRAFNISCALALKVMSITRTHWGASSTA
jgi:hypothetical protein